MIKEKLNQAFNWLKKFDYLENRSKKIEKKLGKVNYQLLKKKYQRKEFFYYLLLAMQLTVSSLFIKQTSLFWVKEYNYKVLFSVTVILALTIVFVKMLISLCIQGSAYYYFFENDSHKIIGNQLKISKYISKAYKILLAASINGMVIGHRKLIAYDTLSIIVSKLFVLIFLLSLTVYLIKENEKAYQKYISGVMYFLLIGGKLQGAEVGKYKFNEYSSVLGRTDLLLVEAANRNFDTSMIKIVGHSVNYELYEEKSLLKMDFKKADVKESSVEQTEYTFTLKIGDIPNYFTARTIETKVTSTVKQYNEGNWFAKLKLLIQSV